jgi:serine/threonine protein kinase
MPLDPNTRLGAYQITKSLGRGAMGEVYQARDLRLGRDVAIKVLRPELASDSERLSRFEQEARAASALNHPNIVHIYDVGETEGHHYIVMELVEGKTLRQVLAGAPLAEDRIRDLARQLAEGLAKAHSEGIVHRDLKPENVMVTEDGFVKILDFGLAKLLTPLFEAGSEIQTLARTRHGMLIGTIEYMSPEQAAGRSADHRSDQFSFGLILYEMATGTLAFRRETAAQTLASIIEGEPPPIAESNPSAPRRLEAIVRRCLRKDPAARYDDTRELARDVKSLLAPAGQASKAPRDEPVVVLPPIPVPAFGGKDYEIDSDGKVKTISEGRLRKRLRSNRYSGMEMVRRERGDAWVPLHETQIFREEVPHRGDPRDAAAMRRLFGFFNHFAVFFVFGVFTFAKTGEVPFWMGYWGIGLVSHAVAALPTGLSLLRRRRLAAGETKALAGASAPEEDLLSHGFRDEAKRVRELLERRGGPEAKVLLKEVDGIVERMRDVASKMRDLEEQTGALERERLAGAEADARRRVESSTSARDRKLYERQIEVLRERRETIQKALALLERLRVKQDVTEHQLKQLRLDLSRAEASSAEVPELSSRLQEIRHEVDASEAVDEALARELTS